MSRPLPPPLPPPLALALVLALAAAAAPQLQETAPPPPLHGLPPPPRHKREPAPYHIIKDCITVTSEAGQFFFKAGEEAGSVCGVYLLTDPDRTVELHFDYLDVPCEAGGLVAFVDGWELNGQLFPAEGARPRFRELCGRRRVPELFASAQNAALLQFRVPERGRGFGFSVRFPRNPAPCNILLEGTADVYTLRNYGRRSNCSLAALFPAHMRVLALSVGAAPGAGSERRCEGDLVQLGGADGLDLGELSVAASVCGADPRPGSSAASVLCGVSAVRLVSSGRFQNAVTVAVRPAAAEDLESASLVCGL